MLQSYRGRLKNLNPKVSHIALEAVSNKNFVVLMQLTNLKVPISPVYGKSEIGSSLTNWKGHKNESIAGLLQNVGHICFVGTDTGRLVARRSGHGAGETRDELAGPYHSN